MDKCLKVAALYIATLKAIAIIHQHNHWTTNGEMFYAEHLLFERIYNSALEDLDLAAEKYVGLFGDEVLNYSLQIELLSKVLSNYNKLEGSPVEMSLAVEKDFVKFSNDAYKCFEEQGELSLGLDDMIMSIASNREEAVYLLQQSLSSNNKG
jgi:DNA-binding ferritin-like protein